MEEFAIVRHSLNNENSFNEERIKMFFLINLFSDSRIHHLTFPRTSFKIKILRHETRKRHSTIVNPRIVFSIDRSCTNFRLRKKFSGMSWQIHPKERKKKEKETIDLLRQSKLQGSRPPSEERVTCRGWKNDGKRS